MVITPAWRISPVAAVDQTANEGVLRVDFHDPGDLNYYHAMLETKAVAGAAYRLTGWVKTEGMPGGNGAAFQIGDSRGWEITHSASVTPSVTGTTGWRPVQVEYTTLPDTTAIQISARRLSGTGPVRGTAWYKNITLTRIIPKSLAAVPILTVSASRDASGNKLFLIVTNKDLRNEVAAKLTIKGFKIKAVKAWALTGPSADSTNEDNSERVGVHPIIATPGVVRLPPCSVTAIEVDGGKGVPSFRS
jgi:hypothetical protein